MPESKPLTKIVRPLAKGQITLPAAFRRRLGIDAGTVLSLTLKGGRIEIVPLRAIPQEEALRDYTEDEIQRFLAEDRIDPGTAAKVRRLLGRKKPA
jgi:AbrB family looped-hinge helix DNA binding protein